MIYLLLPRFEPADALSISRCRIKLMLEILPLLPSHEQDFSSAQPMAL
jgi:hypothetical protein